LLVNLFWNLKRFLKKNKIQILKFGLVGLGSTLINFCIYSIVYNLTLVINLASFSGYTCGILNSFYFSDKWVFTRSKNKKTNYAFFLFVVIYFLGGLEMTFIINYIDKLIQNYKFAWLCGAFVAAMNNYLFSKYLLFDE
tara:strand:- start:84 stop:500 length:417 start_codon:yes stop_codon:yes gene_type:complete